MELSLPIVAILVLALADGTVVGAAVVMAIRDFLNRLGGGGHKVKVR